MVSNRQLVKNVLTKVGAKKEAVIPGADLPPVDWIETHFWIPETNGPIKLMPYHKRLLQEAYRTDDEGRFIYSTVVWSDIKKSAKSSIAAAVALERARRLKWGTLKIIANDLKQAQSRVSFYLQRAIKMNPELNAIIEVSKSQTALPNNTIIEAIPIDPEGEAGGGDDLILFSELWGADSEAAKLMWAEMTLSPLKFGRSQRWVETYAGFSGESETLENLYDQGVKQGRLLDIGINYPDGSPFNVYVNDAARLLCIWNEKPMCPWQTPEYYAQEASVLTPVQFARVHRNQWMSSLSKFVADEWWDACKGPLPPLDKYREVAVGIDAGVSSDCFGIVAVSRSESNIITRFVRKWTPPPGGKLEFSNINDPDDVNYPEGVLRWLAKEYNVVAFGYDPMQLHHLCSTLQSENVGFFVAIDQGKPRLLADKQLHDMIRDKRIIHDGNQDLTEHIRNANQKNDPNEHTLRIVKRSQSLKIDLAVCLSMATKMGLQYLAE